MIRPPRACLLVFFLVGFGCSNDDAGKQKPAFDWPVPTVLPVEFHWNKFGEVVVGRFRLELKSILGSDQLELRSTALVLESFAGQAVAELPAEQRSPIEAIVRSQLPSLRLSRAGKVVEVLGVRESQRAIVEAARKAGADSATLEALEARATDEQAIAIQEDRARELWGFWVADYVDLGLADRDRLRRRRPIPGTGGRIVGLDSYRHLGEDKEFPGCVRIRRRMELNQEEAEGLALDKLRSWIAQQGLAGAERAEFLETASIFRITSEVLTSFREEGLRPSRLYREVTTVVGANDGERVKLEEKYDWILRWPQSD